ncbi:MAG: fructose-bisphosphatase class II [Phycisphaerales bacterium]|nr:fructose-bisphosphatase class II [Phycisphaerales bacterium]
MDQQNNDIPISSRPGSHRGMRFGVLDLVRCTEQTAVLMAAAEGRGLPRDVIAQYATLSMAGYISHSLYRPHITVLDEIYERYGTEARPATTPAKIWAALQQECQGTMTAATADLTLEFGFAPVDGKHALSEGRTGGTISSLCFAPYDPNEKPVFAPPRDRAESPRGRGQPADANRSPPWLVLCGSREFTTSVGGMNGLLDTVRTVANDFVGKPVGEMIEALFANPRGVDPLPTNYRTIRTQRTLAVHAEPRTEVSWNPLRTPGVKKRLFAGSSVATGLAAMFPSKGFDCSLAIARHAHVLQVCIAARVLDGVAVAVPLCKKNDQLVVEASDVWPHTRFVRSDDAALIASGISENVVLEPVRFRDNVATVNTLCLSARTKSVRVLEHRLTVDGPSATQFVAFDASALDHIESHQKLPNAEWLPAARWMDRFDEMFNNHLQGSPQ